MATLLSFDCPRCGVLAEEEFYGPCRSCVTVLRSVGGVQTDVQAVEYAPKMNVTPNFIATKD